YENYRGLRLFAHYQGRGSQSVVRLSVDIDDRRVRCRLTEFLDRVVAAVRYGYRVGDLADHALQQPPHFRIGFHHTAAHRVFTSHFEMTTNEILAHSNRPAIGGITGFFYVELRIFRG